MTAESGATAGVTQPPAQVRSRAGRKAPLSEGARAERRLGWLLCAPAVIVMLAVTAYPIVYAIWLSLQRYDLRFPAKATSSGWPTTPPCSPAACGGRPSASPRSSPSSRSPSSSSSATTPFMALLLLAGVSLVPDDLLRAAKVDGVGSAISVLIFIAVAIIAFVFVKGFGTAAPGQEVDRR
jgi:hypothetical protein